MERKKIQEERIRGYFIQATKEILKGEGLSALSVRNIADRAGYSYATLYNYFKEQYKFAGIPHKGKLLIEHTSVGNNQYSVVHSCFGRRTNDALSRAVAYIIAKMHRCNVQIILTDSNFVLVYNGILILCNNIHTAFRVFRLMIVNYLFMLIFLINLGSIFYRKQVI